ncbi:hypothetical protein H6F46_11820 [Limnothrix sp. FACHB-1083]|uniref:hypothetical protein n=1 Tax=unclassified Limnothrix TaxID=2632864 RepID=UPI0016808839|nr:MULTISPECIES: hypothetical protein [unclassified Limnothrix]MBD2161377.1 hypothetical protein [Limnothrix sp. FACHB-1083]MBD2192111.1 hypothetical protein [Limnothrix sp. FACHB-1088]
MLIELIAGWVIANMRGPQNQDLVPWGEIEGVYDQSREVFFDNYQIGFFQSVRWAYWRLIDHAMLGWSWMANLEDDGVES